MLTLHDKIGSKEVMSIDSVLAFAIFPARLLAQKKNSLDFHYTKIIGIHARVRFQLLGFSLQN